MEAYADEYPALTAKAVAALFQLAGADGGAGSAFQMHASTLELATTGTEGVAVRYALACPRQPAEEVASPIRLAWRKRGDGSRHPRLVCPHCGRRIATLRLTWQGPACQECINAGFISPSRCRAERMHPRLAPEDASPLRPAWLSAAASRDSRRMPFAEAMRLAIAYAKAQAERQRQREGERRKGKQEDGRQG